MQCQGNVAECGGEKGPINKKGLEPEPEPLSSLFAHYEANRFVFA